MDNIEIINEDDDEEEEDVGSGAPDNDGDDGDNDDDGEDEIVGGAGSVKSDNSDEEEVLDSESESSGSEDEQDPPNLLDTFDHKEEIDIWKDSDAFYDTYDIKKNKLSPTLNKYERTCIISIRAEQLSLGTNTYLSNEEIGDITNVIEISEKELESGKLPFIIKRPIANNNMFEYWKLSDLEF
jgi:DNA-directed RNA polymerase subunit K/omega